MIYSFNKQSVESLLCAESKMEEKQRPALPAWQAFVFGRESEVFGS